VEGEIAGRLERDRIGASASGEQVESLASEKMLQNTNLERFLIAEAIPLRRKAL
jgi:hypothetical protein